MDCLHLMKISLRMPDSLWIFIGFLRGLNFEWLKKNCLEKNNFPNIEFCDIVISLFHWILSMHKYYITLWNIIMLGCSLCLWNTGVCMSSFENLLPPPVWISWPLTCKAHYNTTLLCNINRHGWLTLSPVCHILQVVDMYNSSWSCEWYSSWISLQGKVRVGLALTNCYESHTTLHTLRVLQGGCMIVLQQSSIITNCCNTVARWVYAGLKTLQTFWWVLTFCQSNDF